MKNKLLLVSLFFTISFCFGQKQREGIDSQINARILFDSAQYYLDIKNYDRAIILFNKLATSDPKNANWNFNLGLSYLNSRTEFTKAVVYLERAVDNTSVSSKERSGKEVKAPVIAFKYLGDAYHRNYRFDDAILSYNRMKKILSEKDPLYTELDHLIQVCNNAKALVKKPVNMQIKNLGPNINSPYPDYAPVLSADETILLFTSRRPENIGGMKDETGKYFDDIYISYKDDKEDGWQPAKNIGVPINTPGYEATISVSVDGQILFIYKDDEGGSIYVTSMQGENWAVPEKVRGDVNSPYWESHASLSADGNTLYFVSNRPGGYGGRDIYRCKKLPNGEWSRAYNLGSTINTPYEEDSPFIQPGTNTLYFSSEGHTSMGGFDILTTQFVDTGINGGWTAPVNLGYPINTTGDDVFFVPTIDKKRAYYSSFTQGGYGETDIYMLTFPENEDLKLTVLRGTVLDDFGKAPAGMNIAVADAASGTSLGRYSPNPKTGKYLFIVPQGKSYRITYEAEGYNPVNNIYKVESGNAYSETETAITLKDLRMEKQQLGTIGVHGIVKDVNSKPIKNVSITAINNANGEVMNKYAADSKGEYHLVLDRGKNYNLQFEATGFLFQSENINLPKEQTYSSLEKNVVLQPIVAGSKIILKNLFFDSNKYLLRKESFVELGKLYDLMKEKSNLKVEVSGYTDNKGNDKLNKQLSNNRAKAVVDYLVKKGISKTRFNSVGFGKEHPVALNETEEGRQMNRRVEFKILNK